MDRALNELRKLQKERRENPGETLPTAPILSSTPRQSATAAPDSPPAPDSTDPAQSPPNRKRKFKPNSGRETTPEPPESQDSRTSTAIEEANLEFKPNSSPQPDLEEQHDPDTD